MDVINKYKNCPDQKTENDTLVFVEDDEHHD